MTVHSHLQCLFFRVTLATSKTTNDLLQFMAARWNLSSTDKTRDVVSMLKLYHLASPSSSPVALPSAPAATSPRLPMTTGSLLGAGGTAGGDGQPSLHQVFSSPPSTSSIEPSSTLSSTPLFTAAQSSEAVPVREWSQPIEVTSDISIGDLLQKVHIIIHEYSNTLSLSICSLQCNPPNCPYSIKFVLSQ